MFKYDWGMRDYLGVIGCSQGVQGCPGRAMNPQEA